MADFDDHETEQLLLLAQSGDPSAIQTLFQRYRPRLKRMVTYRMDRRLAVRIDSSDVVQDALTQAHVHFSEYLNDRPVAFYPWLRQIAWNRLQDLHRRHVDAKCRSVSREVSRSTELSDASAVLLARSFAASDTGPYQRLARQELREKIEQAISRLSGSLREALLLRYLEQLSATDAAQVVGISHAAYKQRLVRALRQLREMLDGGSEEVVR